MVKRFCDCCGVEIEHNHQGVAVETRQGLEDSTTERPRKFILCHHCFGPVQKILTGIGKVSR